MGEWPRQTTKMTVCSDDPANDLRDLNPFLFSGRAYIDVDPSLLAEKPTTEHQKRYEHDDHEDYKYGHHTCAGPTTTIRHCFSPFILTPYCCFIALEPTNNCEHKSTAFS